MTYYTTNDKRTAIHKIPTCTHLLHKANEVQAVRLKSSEARKRRKCRYCFPEEGESTKERGE